MKIDYIDVEYKLEMLSAMMPVNYRYHLSQDVTVSFATIKTWAAFAKRAHNGSEPDCERDWVFVMKASNLVYKDVLEMLDEKNRL